MRIYRVACLVTATTAIAAIGRPVLAVVVWDQADEATYNDGWQSGDDGGQGFGAWTLNFAGTGGHFIGNSSYNGGSPNINTGTNNDEAFGLWSTIDTTDAYRSLDAPLSVGKTFTISMDNGSVNSGGVVGISLQTSSGSNRFELYFSGGASNYTVNSGNGEENSGVGHTTGGLRVEFKLTGANNADVRIYRLQDSTTTESYFQNLPLKTTGDIYRVRAFNYQAGGGDGNNFYVNSMGVPEPTTFSVLAGGILLASMRRKRT